MRRHHHICIQTNCYKASLDFYTRMLGFHVLKETPDFHGRHYNTWLQQEDMLIELQTEKKGDELVPFNKQNRGIVHFCILVDNLQNEYERLCDLGFTDFSTKNGHPLYQVENGMLLKLYAPEGTIIELRDQAEL